MMLKTAAVHQHPAGYYASGPFVSRLGFRRSLRPCLPQPTCKPTCKPHASPTNATPHIPPNQFAVDPTVVGQFLGIALGSILGSYVLQPHLLTAVTEFWDLTEDADSSFLDPFFNLVGIIYGLMGGNTFLFLYERQVNIVQELYGEAFALELLLQQTFLSVPDPTARKEMATCIKQYIAEELYNPIDMTSPFDPSSSISEVIAVVCREQQSGIDVQGIVEATQKLADAQSRRSAVAAQVLPGMHWVFLNALIAIFVLCFLVFNATGSTAELQGVSDERRLAFSALVGVLVLTQQVLYDLNDPIKGLYSFKSSLDARLTYVNRLLGQLELNTYGWVPEELQRMNQLGLIGNMSSSSEAPSIPRPVRKGRKGRMDEESYVSGPLNLYSEKAWVQPNGSTENN